MQTNDVAVEHPSTHDIEIATLPNKKLDKIVTGALDPVVSVVALGGQEKFASATRTSKDIATLMSQMGMPLFVNYDRALMELLKHAKAAHYISVSEEGSSGPRAFTNSLTLYCTGTEGTSSSPSLSQDVPTFTESALDAPVTAATGTSHVVPCREPIVIRPKVGFPDRPQLKTARPSKSNLLS